MKDKVESFVVEYDDTETPPAPIWMRIVNDKVFTQILPPDITRWAC
jgi:hypothetical protein